MSTILTLVIVSVLVVAPATAVVCSCMLSSRIARSE